MEHLDNLSKTNLTSVQTQVGLVFKANSFFQNIYFFLNFQDLYCIVGHDDAHECLGKPIAGDHRKIHQEPGSETHDFFDRVFDDSSRRSKTNSLL
jgi:hypothetical protein